MTWAEQELGEGDGEPGVKTLWQGMHDLRRAVQAAEILQEAGAMD